MEKIVTNFVMCEMQYRGGTVESDIEVVPFEECHYIQYRYLVDSCYYEMRRALDIRPYEEFCESLPALLKRKNNIFLHIKDSEIIAAVTIFGNEIGELVVNPRHQGKGFGRQIAKYAIKHLQMQNISPITLNVTKWNIKAIGLYESLGFEIISENKVKGESTMDENGNWIFKFISTEGMDLR